MDLKGLQEMKFKSHEVLNTERNTGPNLFVINTIDCSKHKQSTLSIPNEKYEICKYRAFYIQLRNLIKMLCLVLLFITSSISFRYRKSEHTFHTLFILVILSGICKSNPLPYPNLSVSNADINLNPTNTKSSKDRLLPSSSKHLSIHSNITHSPQLEDQPASNNDTTDGFYETENSSFTITKDTSKDELMLILLEVLQRLDLFIPKSDSNCLKLEKITSDQTNVSASPSRNESFEVKLLFGEVYKESSLEIDLVKSCLLGQDYKDVPVVAISSPNIEKRPSARVKTNEDTNSTVDDSSSGKLSRTQLVVIATCSAIIGLFFIVAAFLRIRNYIKRFREERANERRPKFRSCSVALRNPTLSMEQLRRDSSFSQSSKPLAGRPSPSNSYASNGSERNGISRANSSASSPRMEPDTTPLLVITRVAPVDELPCSSHSSIPYMDADSTPKKKPPSPMSDLSIGVSNPRFSVTQNTTSEAKTSQSHDCIRRGSLIQEDQQTNAWDELMRRGSLRFGVSDQIRQDLIRNGSLKLEAPNDVQYEIVRKGSLKIEPRYELKQVLPRNGSLKLEGKSDLRQSLPRKYSLKLDARDIEAMNLSRNRSMPDNIRLKPNYDNQRRSSQRQDLLLLTTRDIHNPEWKSEELQTNNMQINECMDKNQLKATSAYYVGDNTAQQKLNMKRKRFKHTKENKYPKQHSNSNTSNNKNSRSRSGSSDKNSLTEQQQLMEQSKNILELPPQNDNNPQKSGFGFTQSDSSIQSLSIQGKEFSGQTEYHNIPEQYLIEPGKNAYPEIVNDSKNTSNNKVDDNDNSKSENINGNCVEASSKFNHKDSISSLPLPPPPSSDELKRVQEEQRRQASIDSFDLPPPSPAYVPSMQRDEDSGISLEHISEHCQLPSSDYPHNHSTDSRETTENIAPDNSSQCINKNTEQHSLLQKTNLDNSVVPRETIDV